MLTRLERLCIFYTKEHEILKLPLDLQLHLFDHIILPIALYSCEVSGFENIQLIENLHNEFIRRLTNLRKSTPIYMLHAEQGRRPTKLT